MRFQLHVFLILLTTTLMVSSCGKNDEFKNHSGSNSEPVSLTPFDQLAGEWTGTYQSLSDENLQSGDTIKCELNLLATGEFYMSIESGAQSYAAGRWSVSRYGALSLNVDESANIGRNGSWGEFVWLNYDLLGTRVQFNSNEFKLKLSRKPNPTYTPSRGDGFSH